MVRPLGSQNKVNVAAREAIQMAFNKSGGVEELTKWAKANRTDFYKLYARLVPVEINGDMKLTFEPLIIKQSG